MTHTIKKTLFILALAVSAFGCGPYYGHHYGYGGNYDPGYSGGYGRGSYAPYSTPYYGPSGRNWGESRHHPDYDHDGD